MNSELSLYKLCENSRFDYPLLFLSPLTQPSFVEDIPASFSHLLLDYSFFQHSYVFKDCHIISQMHSLKRLTEPCTH